MSEHVVEVSREELEQKRRQILDRFPALAELSQREACHRSCLRWEIAADYGHDLGDAFEELEDVRFLLGE